MPEQRQFAFRGSCYTLHKYTPSKSLAICNAATLPYRFCSPRIINTLKQNWFSSPHLNSSLSLFLFLSHPLSTWLPCPPIRSMHFKAHKLATKIIVCVVVASSSIFFLFCSFVVHSKSNSHVGRVHVDCTSSRIIINCIHCISC